VFGFSESRGASPGVFHGGAAGSGCRKYDSVEPAGELGGAGTVGRYDDDATTGPLRPVRSLQDSRTSVFAMPA
jgi:hypothetical protein